MLIVSITAMKGGVGKTALSLNLAGSLALAGKRVLAIDNDPQASLSSILFGSSAVDQMPPDRTTAAIYRGLEPSPEKIVRPSGLVSLDVVPGSIAADEFDVPRPYKAPADQQACLREFLAEVRGEFDFVIIDNPPSLKLANWAAMLAADLIAVPVVPEDPGTSSLSPVLDVIKHVQSGPNRRVRMVGMIPSMVQPRLNVHIDYEAALRSIHGAGVFENRILAASDIKLAISNGLPVVNHKPRCAASKAYRAIADEMLARVEAMNQRTEAA